MLRVNTLRPRHNGSHFAADILKCIFLNENAGVSIKISLKFVHKSPINNFPALVQIMAWRRPGDKPLSEPIIVKLPTHICVTQPQWVNTSGAEIAIMLLVPWDHHPPEWLIEGDCPPHLVQRKTIDLQVSIAVQSLLHMAWDHFSSWKILG